VSYITMLQITCFSEVFEIDSNTIGRYIFKLAWYYCFSCSLWWASRCIQGAGERSSRRWSWCSVGRDYLWYSQC